MGGQVLNITWWGGTGPEQIVLGGGAGPEHIVKRQIYSKTTQFSGKDQTILKLSKSAKILVCFLGEA